MVSTPLTKGVIGRRTERIQSGIDYDTRMTRVPGPGMINDAGQFQPRVVGEPALATDAVVTRVLSSVPGAEAVTAATLRDAAIHLATAYGLITHPNSGNSVRGMHPDVIIRAQNMPANVVNTTQLASGPTNADRAVDSNHQKDNSTINRVIASNAVDGRTVAGNSLAGGHMVDRAFGNRVIDTDAVDGRTIKVREIGNDHLKDSSVDGRAVRNKEIRNDHLKDDSVDGRALRANSVAKGHLAFNPDQHNHPQYATDAALQNHIASGHGGGGMMPPIIPMSMMRADQRDEAQRLRDQLARRRPVGPIAKSVILLLDILLAEAPNNETLEV